MKTLFTALLTIILSTATTNAQDPEEGEYRSHALLCSGSDPGNLSSRILFHADTDEGGMAVHYTQGNPNAIAWEVNYWRYFGSIGTVYFHRNEDGEYLHTWLVFGTPGYQMWHYDFVDDRPEGDFGNYSCKPQGNTDSTTTTQKTNLKQK